MGKKEKRFKIKNEETSDFGTFTTRIIVDTCTGVNYLVTIVAGIRGGAPSVIPLLDKDGKVVVDTLPIED